MYSRFTWHTYHFNFAQQGQSRVIVYGMQTRHIAKHTATCCNMLQDTCASFFVNASMIMLTCHSATQCTTQCNTLRHTATHLPLLLRKPRHDPRHFIQRPTRRINWCIVVISVMHSHYTSKLLAQVKYIIDLYNISILDSRHYIQRPTRRINS